MCTYRTESFGVTASGKGPSTTGVGPGTAGTRGTPDGAPTAGWVGLSEAMVYFDHPVHLAAEHSLNIDFLAPGAGPAARVAVELDPASAKALAEAILSTLEGAAPVAPEVAAAPRSPTG